ncbi:single-stranded DNA-binding protein 4 isoform X3 [Elephas maximus indicus]|uniref:single-stranded DNA-binding protein 4 isoform X3 n=1 Tax=Elephas maximus indicus TaxID=99487 RepID=UPI0021170F81|nr:single-stranded DNA-binding protein 4 isoform X3 [Elephas maximus indicus]
MCVSSGQPWSHSGEKGLLARRCCMGHCPARLPRPSLQFQGAVSLSSTLNSKSLWTGTWLLPRLEEGGVWLALYVYEYLLHVGAQKSAQTFLSEIRWEKNITLGEPPGFLHSWWCVFWDLYCAAPDRREAFEHSSEAKAFQDYSTAAAPSPVMGSLAPNDAMAPSFFQGPPSSQPPPHNPNTPMMGPHGQPFMSPRFPGGPRPTLRMPSQPPVGLPGSQPLLPGSMDPSRVQGHPSMGGPMQRVTPPRGMAGVGPQSYGSGIRPLPNSLAGPGLPALNMGPGVRGPWASPSGNSIPYSSSSPGSYTGPPGGGGPPGTPIMASPGDSNSSENMYTIMNPIGPSASRANFPLGPGPEGPMAAMSAMEPHHVNGSLGSGDMDGLPKVRAASLWWAGRGVGGGTQNLPLQGGLVGVGPRGSLRPGRGRAVASLGGTSRARCLADRGRPQSSPGAVAGLSNAPGTPRDDGEMAAAGTFLHPFPSESYSPGMTMSV